MVEGHILERSKISAYTDNKDLRYLRATFNYGVKKKLITLNPTEGIEFLPEDKNVKNVPSIEDIDKVIAAADPDTQDYLWTIRETMGRVSEINRLTWDNINFEQGYVILYTRKKKGGHLIPRKVAMTEKLHEILSRKYSERDKAKPWVFWHTYTDWKTDEKKEGPFKYRRTILRTLCMRAGVKYFGFHALRHSGVSIMDQNNVPIGAIQKILGHENRSTTEIYLHSLDQTERDAISTYERARKDRKLSHKSHMDDKKEGQDENSSLA